MMQWSEIVQLSKQTGIHRNTIKWRSERGMTGKDLVKPPRAGNYQITEEQAREIWADIQMLVSNCRYREFDICQVVAEHHGVGKYLVQNIRSGGSWISVSGLDKSRHY